MPFSGLKPHDRIVHDAHRMELIGKSLRKRQQGKLNEELEIEEKNINL